MTINGQTQVFGIIGNPIKHTMSPRIHNSLANYFGHNLVYLPFEVEKEKVHETFRGFWAAHVKGFNVTVPFKQEIIHELIAIDEEAKQIGAVNTVKWMEEGYKGYNTDINGLHHAMLSEDICLKDQDIVVLGAGGSSKSVSYLCGREGAKQVFIVNRSQESALSLIKSVQEYHPNLKMTYLGLDEIHQLPEKDLIAIQTTPVGMSTYANQALIESEDFYKRLIAGIDLIYNPAKTLFMKKAEAHGAKTMNGLKMLVYQAVLAYEIWMDVKIDDSALIENIFRELYEEIKG